MRPRLLFVLPDRGSAQDREWEDTTFWPAYRDAARRAGLDLEVVVPEHVQFTAGEARWRGEPLLPERDLVVYSTRANPTHGVDLWNGMSTVRSLEALGFWSAIPIDQAVLLNDKFATAEALRDSPVPTIPSVRVTTGRDLGRTDVQALVPDDWFPVFVKPASWGRGLGCLSCPDRTSLDGALGLASGSDAPVVIQPTIRDVVADTRVVVVEGEIVSAYDRLPPAEGGVANVSKGASTRLRSEIEPQVERLASLVRERFGLAYLCIDLLRTEDGGLWLAECEPDGAVTGLLPHGEEAYRVLGARFTAYARAHARHLDTLAARGVAA
ncbi:ATP-grasp domain-containing protein [Myceligenerans xiligouense]|uniref:Glutathione synthase/RimK-type ligase-like ATP-grasp enzyme n=1 Tax=Myceligenerans xiligouense TaxID=253184 RepID=A0A3N4YQJ0_9MICO|nr:hypothetical protein [Myceligenerans xiligouense]RPF20750.1 glutathione synthase/RimK-type ligase-like ATP-grasp enzyme [Myceligenerans xiligouense]